MKNSALARRGRPFVHQNALCESSHVGRGTRIWAFAHVLPRARIGTDCNICEHVFVENDVLVGDRVTVKCGVQLWDGLRVGNDVFIGPNATFTNDRLPRSRRHQSRIPITLIEDGASVGANATILPGLRIGRGAMVGAGAVVTADVPASSVVAGNPARVIGYCDAPRRLARSTAPAKVKGPGRHALGIEGAFLFRFRPIQDPRGTLVAGNLPSEVPFTPRRFFFVFDVPSKDVRGEHAHRRCQQFLICVRGSVAVVLDDGNKREEIALDAPDVGLYVPPMVWGVQYRYSADAVLLVLASQPYDPADYIRDYGLFRQERAARRRKRRSVASRVRTP